MIIDRRHRSPLGLGLLVVLFSLAFLQIQQSTVVVNKQNAFEEDDGPTLKLLSDQVKQLQERLRYLEQQQQQQQQEKEKVEISLPSTTDGEEKKTDVRKTVSQTTKAQTPPPSSPPPPQPPERLNVILFYPDDWSKENVGYLDEHQILKTPTFNQLAREGIHFLQNAVTTSICWISRANLFTGQYVSNHRSYYLRGPKFTMNFNQWKFTWPYLLQREAGYWVGHIGKWQFHLFGKHLFNYTRQFEGWIKQENKSTGQDEFIADYALDATLDFLRTRPLDRPFATTVAFYPPKGVSKLSETKPEFAALYENVTHPEPRTSRYEAFQRLPVFLQNNITHGRARYILRFEPPGSWQEATAAQFATISHIDDIVGKIIAELKAQNAYENTLIIVSADNGEFSGAKSLSDKWYPYQQSIQVPLIIRDPRMSVEQRGTQNDALTLNIDLAETILGAAGIESPWIMDGRDIADLYLPADRHVGGGGSGDAGNTNSPSNIDFAKSQSSKSEREKAIIDSRKRSWRNEFFYEFPPIDRKIPSSNALVRKDWKYIAWQGENLGYEELFDLKNDPTETNNLIGNISYATIHQEMQMRMKNLKNEIYWRVHGFIPHSLCDPIPGESGGNCSLDFSDHCCSPYSTSIVSP